MSQIENFAHWTQALRSGSYVQGNSCLRQQVGDGEAHRFCCLGVGLNGMDPGGWADQPIDEDDGMFTHRWSDAAGHFPEYHLFEEWFGVSNDVQRTLAHLNDNESLDAMYMVQDIEGVSEEFVEKWFPTEPDEFGGITYAGDAWTFSRIADFLEALHAELAREEVIITS